jgi:uncharacterized protein YbjT (DUF2867 family)
MKITLTGSIGHIGKPLTEQLVKRGHQASVITSNPERAKEIESLGATAMIGKLDDVNFITRAFTDAHAVFCMTPPDFNHPDQLLYYETLAHNYAQAIQRSGVSRVVHLSSYGAHLPSGTGFITGSHRAEQILNPIPNIQLTHARPTFFYYNLLAFTGMIKAAGFIGAVYGGEDKLAFVSPSDIADAVAQELEIVKDFNQIRYINSDERTCNQAAEVLGKAIGVPALKWIALPKDQVLQVLLGRGVPENAASNLVELGEALHTGRLLEDFELHKPAFGKVKLEDYANKFAAVYHNYQTS